MGAKGRGRHNAASPRAAANRNAALLSCVACVISILIFALMVLPAAIPSGIAYAQETDQAEVTAGDEATGEAEGPASDSGGTVAEGNGESSGDDAAASSPTSGEAEAQPEGETIEDEENPMASGIEKRSMGMPLYGLTMMVIAAVVVFFVRSMRKVNSNIALMNRKIR